MSALFPTKAEALTQLFEELPILATQVGCRADSTEGEQRVMHAAFAAHRAWQEVMTSTDPLPATTP